MSSQVAPSNRPEDTAFKQQRLKAWQPILTPLWVILTFVAIGIMFIPIGIVLKVQSDNVFEKVVYYDSPTPDVNCRITTQNAGYQRIQAGNPLTCVVDIAIDRDIPESSKLNVYYQLSNFYQNHRRYVKSRSDPQVGGRYQSDALLKTACDPAAAVISNATNLIFAPCGLIATSFFNDAFFVHRALTSGSNATVRIDESNIAWKTDLTTKFKNPTNPPGSTPETRPLNAWDRYQYIWQTYDQMSCYDAAGVRQVCQTWSQVVGNPAIFGLGCARCPPNTTPRYEGGIPPPNGPQNFDPTPGIVGDANALYGFRDEHLLVWMRSAGLPTFRKLYGVVTAPPGGFKRGDVLSFEVVTNFEVQSFGGTKALVLSTQTPTGGKSDILGIAYLVVGSLCLALALAFAIKHIVAPRKLGDPQYIVWRHGGKQ